MIVAAQTLVFFLLYFTVFVLAVWALVDAAIRPTAAYLSGGKRTKGFWLAVTGVSTAVAFVAIPRPFGLGLMSFLALGAAVGAIVYLVDVRPAIRPYSGRGGGPRGGSGPRGGW